MAKESTQLSTDDLDALLSDESESSPADFEEVDPNTSDAGGLPDVPQDQSGMGLDQASLDALVGSLGAEEGGGAGGDQEASAAPGSSIADLSALSTGPASPSAKTDNLDLLQDIRLRFTVELGRSQMLIKDVLKLGNGSIVELDRDVGEDVDILINDRVFGRGKLKLVDEYFGIQITKIQDKMEKYRKNLS